MKSLGGILVVISSYLLSQYYISSMKKRIKTIESFLRFFSIIETRISYEYSSFLHIFQDVGQKNTDVISLFLGRCLDEIEKGISLQVSWDRGVEDLLMQKYLKREDAEVLKDFAKGLGESDVEGQKSNIKLYTEILSSKLKDAQKEYKDKSKVTVSGCVFTALFLVILLI